MTDSRNCHAAPTPRARARRVLPLMLAGLLWSLPAAATAQPPVPGVLFGEGYQPLRHDGPPGKAAAWLQAIRGENAGWLQPIRVELPSDGTVSVHAASPEPAAVLAPPAQFSVSVGHVYRLRVADLPEFPGVEIYPTVEVLDRLHPPAGRENDYPIPIVLTEDDLRTALSGQLVTRVVYLEQPQLAATQDPLRREVPQSVAAGDNALAAADRFGRPMLIVRIGGRTPSPRNTPPSFFGSGGQVDASWTNADPDPSAATASRPPQRVHVAASTAKRHTSPAGTPAASAGRR